MDCPYKDRIDLKFCTSYGLGDHSLEDCPTILEKINKKKNVNFLSCVKKSDILCTKNLHIVTRQERKTRSHNPRISKIKDQNEYPNPIKQKQLYNDASSMFQEFTRQQDVYDKSQNTLRELLNLIHKDKSVPQFIDLLHNIKNKNDIDKHT